MPHIWSMHIRDRNCPLCFTNSKGATRKGTLASALGKYFERLSTNYFFANFYLSATVAGSEFVHYPNARWFALPGDGVLADGILDDHLRAFL